MNEFETQLNGLFTDIFNYVLRYEELSLRAISKTPVTVTEAHILEVIGNKKNNVTVSEIASALKISAPTATIAVKKLMSKDLVTKNICAEDGRRLIIGLTEVGEKIYRAHELFHRRMVRSVSADITDAEKDVLLCAVNKLSEFFKEKVET